MKLVNNKNYNLSMTLIIVNILVFIISVLINPRLNIYMGLDPERFIRNKFYWTILTHMFAHSSFSHLFFNMFMIFMFGHTLEEKMGSFKFIIYYIITGSFAGLFSLFIYYIFSMNVLLVGASGAIYAVLFAYAVIFPNRKIYIFGLIPINPPTLIAVFTLFNIYSQIFRDTNVAHITHLSGFLFAYLYFRFIYKIDPIYIFKNYKRFR